MTCISSPFASRILRSFALLVAISALVGLGMEQLGVAQSAPSQGRGIPPALQIQCLDGGLARSAIHRQTGALRFAGTQAGRSIPQPVAVAATATSEAAARSYLSICGSLFGLRDQSSQLGLVRQEPLEGQRSFARFQQLERGVPVIGGELIVQLDPQKDVLSVSGEVLPTFTGDTTPAVSPTIAAQTAREVVAKTYALDAVSLITTPPALWVYEPGLIGPVGDPSALVWRMDVSTNTLAPIRELVLVDAQRGAVLLHFNQVESARLRETYTANNGTSLPGTLVCNETNPTCAGGDAHAVGAHVYAGHTYDFYLATHGRDGINGLGMVMRSTVHYDTNYVNAFWNGSQMVYGDGAGFALADDVVGHELTHGVTQFTSSLFYHYQSGAIDESFSDVWGEFIDQTNGAGDDSPSVKWLLGEDISGVGATRNMQNPPAFGDPDRITSALYNEGDGDDGGVHTNSGVNNKAAYLMTDGGTFNGQTVGGLGITKVAKIYYEAQTNLLTSGADYLDLYDALYQGCNNLVGTAGITTADCQQVRNATLAVEMHLQPAAGFNPDATVCPAGQTPNNLFFDNMENTGTGNFAFAATTGTTRWQYAGGYAHSGLLELYAQDSPGAVTDTTASMTNSYAIPANAYLHFAQAFGFETPTFDGGVIEYSTNGGATWNDAGALIDSGGGYNGTIATGFLNPLSGRSAFVGTSHGYISSRLSLASLAGQSVRFRWRMGLDSSASTLGWVLDDVRIYTCPISTPPTISMTDVTVAEGSGSTTAIFTVSLSTTSGSTVTVDFATANGTATAPSDYTSRSGTVTFVPGDTSETISVPITGDVIPELTEIFVVNLSGAVNATIADAQGQGTITDSDVASLSINDVSVTEGQGGSTDAVLTVSLTPAYHSTATVDYSTSNGTATAPTDYAQVSGTLTFAAGETSKTVAVPVNGDTTSEPNETFSVILSNPSGGAIVDGTGIGTIVTDDILSEDLAIDFGTAGLWGFYNNSSYSSIHPASPEEMATGDLDGNGQSDLILDFPGYGIWVWSNNSTWVQLHPFNAAAIVTGDLDGDGRTDVLIDFPGYGLWVYMNNATWSQLHQVSPARLVTGDLDGNGQAEAIVDFAGYGIWVWSNNSAWSQLHVANAAAFVVGDFDGEGKADVLVSFPGYGLWVWRNNATWSQLHGTNASVMTTGDLDGDGKDDAIISFTGFGIWAWMNNATFVQLHASNASLMKTADLDGNGRADLIISFPGFGVWAWMNNSNFVQLHAQNPEGVVAGNLDAN